MPWELQKTFVEPRWWHSSGFCLGGFHSHPGLSFGTLQASSACVGRKHAAEALRDGHQPSETLLKTEIQTEKVVGFEAGLRVSPKGSYPCAIPKVPGWKQDKALRGEA